MVMISTENDVATLVNVFTVEPENPHIKPIMEIAKFDAHLYEVVDSLP